MTAVVVALSWFAVGSYGPFAILLPFVFGHFLLFCNVFRIGTDFEVIWAVWLVLVVTATSYLGCFDWWLASALQTPVTVGLVVAAMRSPWYHGVWCRRLNPALDSHLQDPKRHASVVLDMVRRVCRVGRSNPGPGSPDSQPK